MKDILSFSTWKLKFTALATKDGLSRILEPSYIPGTDPEKHLFSAQQQFLFAVFTQTLVDPTAKDTVLINFYSVLKFTRKLDLNRTRPFRRTGRTMPRAAIPILEQTIMRVGLGQWS